MRPLAVLACISMLAAGPAGAQALRPTTEPAPKAEPARSAVNAMKADAEAGRDRMGANLPLSPSLAPLARPWTGDPAQCRASCSRSYYFCLATDSAEDCGPSWGQCRARCERPAS